MSEKSPYQTRQKQCILEFFRRHPDGSFSARDLIKSGELSVGEATIYRTLTTLCKQGIIEKTLHAGSKGAYYQYVENGDEAVQCRVKCVDCGRIVGLHCHCLDSVKSHFESEHGFSLLDEQPIFYGRCKHCSQAKGGTR